MVDVAGSGKTNVLSAMSQNEGLEFPCIALFAKTFRGGMTVEDEINAAIREDLHRCDGAPGDLVIAGILAWR